MELQHFSHEHPLVFVEDRGNENEKVYCSGCGEMVSGPSFSCVECGFHLDKHCADAPSELSHPFHRNHCFNLLQRKPHNYKGKCVCDFCGKTCENFVYHCSCGLDLHIKCALFSYNIAEKGIAEFHHIARTDPLIHTENRPEKLKNAQCFACWKPLLDSPYFSPDCGFYLHVKCVDLPSEINHLFHQQHPLILQFNSQRLSCHICQKTQRRGFVYSCSSPCNFVLHIECAKIPTKIDHFFHRKHPLVLQHKDDGDIPCHICQKTKPNQIIYCCSICKFALHIECASPTPVIVDKSHPHPFTLFWRLSFICDACGSPGNHVSYICSTCSLLVHKNCISLPRTLRHPMHYEHTISHTYFLGQYVIQSWKCRICHLEEVNSKHGGYYCSVCNYVVHVKCAIEDYNWYEFDESEGIEEDNSALVPYSIIKETKDGENVVATEIKHFTHHHNLVLSNDISDDRYCDGCVLSIFTSYYGCAQCNFFLHKGCAEFPRKKHLWFHRHQKLHPLVSDCISYCGRCYYETSGFAYNCVRCDVHFCLRCALVSDIPRCEGHEHPLPYFSKFEGLCTACGEATEFPYRCESCNFNLHGNCLRLPAIARHNYDEHPYRLTYHDNNKYSLSNYCDICEEERNPNLWFYHCSICKNSAHPKCVLGKYSFIKTGSICKLEDHHPHPLTFVQKVHDYPECFKCGKHRSDLALECKIGCGYIVHWECIKPRPFGESTTIKLLSKDAQETNQ